MSSYQVQCNGCVITPTPRLPPPQLPETPDMTSHDDDDDDRHTSRSSLTRHSSLSPHKPLYSSSLDTAGWSHSSNSALAHTSQQSHRSLMTPATQPLDRTHALRSHQVQSAGRSLFVCPHSLVVGRWAKTAVNPKTRMTDTCIFDAIVVYGRRLVVPPGEFLSGVGLSGVFRSLLCTQTQTQRSPIGAQTRRKGCRVG